jgi:hypothetical protein
MAFFSAPDENFGSIQPIVYRAPTNSMAALAEISAVAPSSEQLVQKPCRVGAKEHAGKQPQKTSNSSSRM